MPVAKQSMRSLCFFLSILVGLPLTSAQAASKSIHIKEINVVDQGPTRVAVSIVSDGPFDIVPTLIHEDLKLYLDFLGTNILGKVSDQTQEVRHPVVGTVRKVFLGTPGSDAEWSLVDGVILDLMQKVPYEIVERSEQRFVIQVGTESREEWIARTRRRIADKVALGAEKQKPVSVAFRSPSEQRLYEKIREGMQKRAGLQVEDGAQKKAQVKEKPAEKFPEKVIFILHQEAIPYGDYTYVSLRFSSRLRVLPMSMTGPDRIILDLLDENVYSKDPRIVNVNGPRVAKIETVYFRTSPLNWMAQGV